MAKRFTTQTLDREVQDSSLAHCVVFLDKKLCPLTGNILLGEGMEPCNGLASCLRGSSKTPRHASCQGNWDKHWPMWPLALACLYLG